MLDNSGSIGKENFAKMVDFTRNVVNNLDIDGGRGTDGSRLVDE